MKENERTKGEEKRRQHYGGTGGVFLVFLRILRERDGGLNCSRKRRTEEHRVAGESPGHGAEKGDFQVRPLVFFVYFPFFSDYPSLILSDFLFLLVRLFYFGDY